MIARQHHNLPLQHGRLYTPPLHAHSFSCTEFFELGRLAFISALHAQLVMCNQLYRRQTLSKRHAAGGRNPASLRACTAPRAALCSTPSVCGPSSLASFGDDPSSPLVPGARPSPARSAAVRTPASCRTASPTPCSRAQNAAARSRSSGTRWVAAVPRRRRCARARSTSAATAVFCSVCRSSGGAGGAGRRCNVNGSATKSAWRRDQSVSCHYAPIERTEKCE